MRWLVLVLVVGCSALDADAAPVTPRPARADRAPSPAASTEPPRPARDTVLWVGGDVLDGEALRDFARTFDDPADGFAAILEPAAQLWREDDAFVLVNLEVPVADTRRIAHDGEGTSPAGRLRRVHLQGAPWMCEGLARAGVDAVMLANNHALDQDHQGLAETIACARRAGLVVSGAGAHPQRHWPLVLGDEGREVAVHTLYTGLDRRHVERGETERAFLDDEALALVRRSATEHDAVVVIVHVVAELAEEPEDEWREWASRLVDAGADAILVHGTHVPMAVERLGARRVPIAWGLGNLVSDMGRLSGPRRQAARKEENAATREGLLARVRVTGPGALELRLLPVFSLDDRFLRWHGALPPMHGRDGTHAAEIGLSLWPLDACDEPARFPRAWKEPWRTELVAWVRERRDHVVASTGLVQAPCGEIGWLTEP